MRAIVDIARRRSPRRDSFWNATLTARDGFNMQRRRVLFPPRSCTGIELRRHRAQWFAHEDGVVTSVSADLSL